MTVAYAPGKIILVGEHAVVYGRPAVAVPVTQVRAQATVENASKGQGLAIVATDLDQKLLLRGEEGWPYEDPLARTVVATLEYLGLRLEQDLTITVKSDIPIARGLGSGAAVSTAMVRAVAGYFSRNLSPQEVSQLVYEAERIHHGTPSGIDNTVIAHERPVYFVQGQTPQTLAVGRTLWLLIGDSGEPSPTREVVDAVRRRWEKSREMYESLFDRVGGIAWRVRRAIEDGDLTEIGRLMNENHQLLQELGVSSPLLDSLARAATDGGALGAKLSGAGRGGNVIALVSRESRPQVERALLGAGAERVIHTEVFSTTEATPEMQMTRKLAGPHTGAV